MEVVLAIIIKRNYHNKNKSSGTVKRDENKIGEFIKHISDTFPVDVMDLWWKLC